MEVNEFDMDDVRIRKNQREKERVTALKSHFMDLKKRLPFPEEQVKTRAQILMRAAEYVDALERRIFQMQDSQNSDERKNEEIFRKDLSSCRFSSVSSVYSTFFHSTFYSHPQNKSVFGSGLLNLELLHPKIHLFKTISHISNR